MSGPGRRTRPDPHPPTLIRMNLFHRIPPAPTPTPNTPAQPSAPAKTRRRLARRALRILAYGILTGAATTAGNAAMDIVITLIHHH